MKTQDLTMTRSTCYVLVRKRGSLTPLYVVFSSAIVRPVQNVKNLHTDLYIHGLCADFAA